MEIIRNGEKIELTDDELVQIYRLKKQEYEKEDICERLKMLFDDDDADTDTVGVGWHDFKAGDLRKLLADDDFVTHVAERFDSALDSNDHIAECYWETADDVLKYEIPKWILSENEEV